MTISARLEFSHKYSFNSPIRGVFRLIIVPEKVSVATGFHYIILLDTSGSMSGIKIETAKKGAIELLNKIPPGNKITFITFSSNVNTLIQFADNSSSIIERIYGISAQGNTVLYSALSTAIQIARRYEMPGYIVLLTDGNPTDVTDITAYENLQIPDGFKVISFGIGDDYNEQLLKILADKSGGVLNHIQDPMEIANSLPQAAVTQVGAKNVIVEIEAPSQVKLLNYSGPPVKLGAIEGVVRIYGETSISPNYSGNVLNVRISYNDPATNRQEVLTLQAQVSPASDSQMFLSGINNDVLGEYQYYELMNKLVAQVNSNNLTEATRTLNQMTQLAQQTRRIELMETTRRLQQSIETTKRLGNVEQTRKLITSEATKKLRSS
ncbi:VWA domain-containing protein [Sulfurisphaera javensis]|uniref:VWA domain-containing protein n=1 Tax=Sulfurisphaera javensis TaxID=2049879 RepID=A0AAT9GST0_9CREN